MKLRGRTRLKMLLGVLGIFALGCVTGASLDSTYRLRASNSSSAVGQSGREDFFEAMQNNLNLSSQQATEIRAIVDETRGGTHTRPAHSRTTAKIRHHHGPT
jgi:hypothetical protein